MALVFDIETIGYDYDNLDETTQVSLNRWIKRQAAGNKKTYNVLLADLKEGLGFSPLTAKIVALGVYDTRVHKGVVYFQSPDREASDRKDGSFVFKVKTEPEIINLFWEGAKRYKRFISFNGRSFDLPFIILRGAKYKIKPSVDLMSRRYLNLNSTSLQHVDLFDQLSYYGAVRRRGNLHLFCKLFGIRSPKGEGITGDDVGRLFKQKKYFEIAEYNSWDLIATAELYKIWKDYIKTP